MIFGCSGPWSVDLTVIFLSCINDLFSFSAGRKVFGDFLRCEYSEENILFWQACEDLKKEKNPEQVEEKARLIYEDFVSILSPKEACYIHYICIHFSLFVRAADFVMSLKNISTVFLLYSSGNHENLPFFVFSFAHKSCTNENGAWN